MNPWETEKKSNNSISSQDISLHHLLASARLSPSTQPTSKRVVYPAVPFMTVKAERKCLSEIRNYPGKIPENFVLSNGMKAEDFALMYVLGHQLKRKEKQTNGV